VREIGNLEAHGGSGSGSRQGAGEDKTSASCAIHGARGRTDVTEIASALNGGRNGLIEGDRLLFVTIFFGEKEEGLVLLRVVAAGDVQGAADGGAGIVLAIQGRTPSLIKEIASVEDFVAQEEVGVPMKLRSTGLGGGNGDPGSAPAVLSAVVRSEHLERVD